MNERDAEIGARIKKIRQARKITQAQLAKQLDISQTAIALWENGQRSVNIDFIDRIASALNISASYLLFGDIDFNDNVPKEKICSTEQIQEISEILRNAIHSIQYQQYLTLDGKPVNSEAIESILSSMEIGLELARKKNVEKKQS